MVDLENLKKQAIELVPNLEAKLKNVQPFKFLESKVQVENISAYVALGIGFVLLLFTALGFGAQFIVSVAGFVYPAYASFQAIQNNNSNDTQWLSFWMIYALFVVFESISESLIEAIPLYYILKLGALIWFQLGGAQVVYNLIQSKLGNNTVKTE